MQWAAQVGALLLATILSASMPAPCSPDFLSIVALCELASYVWSWFLRMLDQASYPAHLMKVRECLLRSCIVCCRPKAR